MISLAETFTRVNNTKPQWWSHMKNHSKRMINQAIKQTCTKYMSQYYCHLSITDKYKYNV